MSDGDTEMNLADGKYGANDRASGRDRGVRKGRQGRAGTRHRRKGRIRCGSPAGKALFVAAGVE